MVGLRGCAAIELKGVAKDLDMSIWTARQTSDKNWGKEYGGLQDICGGKGK